MKDKFTVNRYLKVNGPYASMYPVIAFRISADHKNDRLKIAWAACNSEDQFSRKEANQLLRKRMRQSGEKYVVKYPWDKEMSLIQNCIEAVENTFIEKDEELMSLMVDQKTQDEEDRKAGRKTVYSKTKDAKKEKDALAKEMTRYETLVNQIDMIETINRMREEAEKTWNNDNFLVRFVKRVVEYVKSFVLLRGRV